MGGGLSQLGTKQQQWLAPSGGLGAEERVEHVVLPSVFLSLHIVLLLNTINTMEEMEMKPNQFEQMLSLWCFKLFGERTPHSLRVHTRKL